MRHRPLNPPARAWGEGGIAVPVDAPRPPRRGAGADRAFAANVLGTLALTIVNRVDIGAGSVTRHGANAPAALVTLLWYPDRPIAFLAARLRISHETWLQVRGLFECEAQAPLQVKGVQAPLQTWLVSGIAHNPERA